MSSTKRVVVVLGATGAQGGPVVKYLLQHSSHLYHVRALTRDSSKPASQELIRLGAEVVQADFSDEESIRAAFVGAHKIFAITNFWDQYSINVEVEQGKLINRLAAQVPTLENYIFSSLADGRGLDGGKYQNILPYNAKALIKEDIVKYESLWQKTTELWVAFYWQNWIKYSVFAPVKEGDEWVLSMPYSGTTRVPSSSSEDVGVVVDTIVKGEGLGLKATFKTITLEEREKLFASLGLPPHLALATAELCASLGFEEEVLTADDIIQASDIIPKDYKLKSWADYVKEEDWSPLIK